MYYKKKKDCIIVFSNIFSDKSKILGMEITEMAKGDKSTMKIKTKRNRIEYRFTRTCSWLHSFADIFLKHPHCVVRFDLSTVTDG